MAAVQQPELISITINGIDLEVPAGELIVESVKRLGLEIPIFCYHPRMKPVGMCRMCLVEVGFKQPDGSVRKMPKPQAGCTLPASAGMVIYTDTEQVHRDRKGVLEFLLVNHPLDCPICDRGGECPLQNNTIFYGPSTSRFSELKRHAHKAFPLSDHVTLDLERCIQCGRCVRFTEEISGDHQLAFRFRGADMQPSTFKLSHFDSKFSGNTIEICPVGALTSAHYRFRARPWDLETRPGLCTKCPNHCNIWFDFRAQKFVRLNGRTNEQVNEEWTCDRGKFGHDWMNSSDRLTEVLVRDGQRFKTQNWSDAYEVLLTAFADKKGEAAFLVGGEQSVETLALLKRFANEVVGSEMIGTAHQTDSTAEDRVADLENRSSLIVFGSSLADELPITYLRVRKAATQRGARQVSVHSRRDEIGDLAVESLIFRPGHEGQVAGALGALASGASPESQASVCEAAGISAEALARVASTITEGTSIITTTAMTSPEAADALRAVARAKGAHFNQYAVDTAAPACEVVGLGVSATPGTAKQIIQSAANFEIKALWLVGVDPFALGLDPKIVTRALENVEFLVVQGPLKSESTGYASVILPAAAPAEQEGTYITADFIAQTSQQVLTPQGNAKAGWRIFAELLLRAKPGKPYFGAREVREELQASSPVWGGHQGALPDEGLKLTLAPLNAGVAR